MAIRNAARYHLTRRFRPRESRYPARATDRNGCTFGSRETALFLHWAILIRIEWKDYGSPTAIAKRVVKPPTPKQQPPQFFGDQLPTRKSFDFLAPRCALTRPAYRWQQLRLPPFLLAVLGCKQLRLAHLTWQFFESCALSVSWTKANRARRFQQYHQRHCRIILQIPKCYRRTQQIYARRFVQVAEAYRAAIQLGCVV